MPRHLQTLNPPESSGISSVLVRADLHRSPRGQDDSQQRSHLLLDRLGIRSSELELELCSPGLLCPRHASLASQLGIGEGIEEVGVGADGEVEVEGEILAELEGFESVDDERFVEVRGVETLEEQAMTAETFYLAHDRRGSDVEFACDLTESGAAEGSMEEHGQEVGELEPVGGGEGLCGEVAVAVEAEEPLDAMGLGVTRVEACPFVRPAAWVPMEGTCGIRAMRRSKGWSPVAHDRDLKQNSGQMHSSKHNPNQAETVGEST